MRRSSSSLGSRILQIGIFIGVISTQQHVGVLGQACIEDNDLLRQVTNSYFFNLYLGDINVVFDIIDNFGLIENWCFGSLNNLSNAFNVDNPYFGGQFEDLSRWDVSKVEYMDHMFQGNQFLQFMDFSFWNTSSVKSMSFMFQDCNNFQLGNLGGMDTSNVESME
mmetsp:Transcript_6728/g.14063  ORF Transcript_6728/g.14063 Transcript_6728/m.14063 type:complete len:165 (-) Transcript_6728:10-504(-)